MKRFFQSGLVIAAGVLGVAAATAQSNEFEKNPDLTKNRKKFDLRETILRKFLKDQRCPAERFAGIFVAEADAHGLDWRLLPSLAFVETGAGKQARGNNLFGWANGKSRFDSISEAIHEVAHVLSEGRYYRDKTLLAKLRVYNRNSGYGALVTGVMERIAPAPLVRAQAE
ncbi:MAG: hypothetical protein JWN34_1060 [Bryobacterales bacterium]|nr:hypothetical protein [Bryobacterales bacterium]